MACSQKTASSSLSFIVQSGTSDQLRALPCWSSGKDTVVCINEWRLGWLASACYCPGLSTILGNLLYPTAYSGKKGSQGDMDLYREGASLEIYSLDPVPSVFDGKRPEDIAYICKQLGLVLIAVGIPGDDNSVRVHVNPSSMHLQSFRDNMKAYILAESRHNLKQLDRLTEDRVQVILQARTSFSSYAMELHDIAEHEELPPSAREGFSKPPRLMPLAKDWKNHFVLCLLTNKKSPAVDLSNFVSAILQKGNGSHLVVVAKETYVQKLMDADHPKYQPNNAVHFVHGSPLEKSTLLKARVEHCRCCALFTVNPNPDTKEPALWDKDAMLCLRVLEGITHDSRNHIPVVLELLEESNVQFVSLEEEEEEEEEQLHLSLPYAFGQVTAMGMLDVLLSASYFDAGGASIAESILKSVCVKEEPASALPHRVTTFGDAFSYYLNKGRLCVAVKRLKASNTTASSLASQPLIGLQDYTASGMSYPITAPDQQLRLRRESDVLVVITHEAQQ